MNAGLAAHIEAEAGSFRLDADIDAAPGEVHAVIGPNGAGKTTLIRCVAGLHPLAGGWIKLDGDFLDRNAHQEEGIHIPAHVRRVGLVFQDYRLFPHLSALDNVAYGLRAQGRGADARREAAAWLARVGLADRANARPAELSGGEAARVALARALASEPRLLLLDEPLGAIDVEARQGIREHLRAVLATLACPCLLVTHDPVEAALLAQRVTVLEGGQVTQSGSVGDMARKPRSQWVARMAGVNLFQGQAQDGHLAVGGAALSLAEAVSGPVFALIRPASVALHRARPEGSPRNVFACTVRGLEAAGERWRIDLDGDLPLVAEVTPGAMSDLEIARGGPLWATVKASEIEVYQD